MFFRPATAVRHFLPPNFVTGGDKTCFNSGRGLLGFALSFLPLITNPADRAGLSVPA
jgi:hypothetical protein